MEIRWFGLGCFRIRSRGLTIITDPFDESVGIRLPRLQADVVTISRETPDCNAINRVSGVFRVFSGPGEYEVGGVFIIGMDARPENHRGGGPTNRQTIYLFEPDGLRVCHLGSLRHVPPPGRMEEAIGKVDVLLVPVGGRNVLDAAGAAEIVGRLEPRIVVPMCYRVPDLKIPLDPVDRFLKLMGTKRVLTVDSLRIGPEDLTDETRIILLHPDGGKKSPSDKSAPASPHPASHPVRERQTAGVSDGKPVRKRRDDRRSSRSSPRRDSGKAKGR